MVNERVLCLEQLVSVFAFTTDDKYEISSLVELSTKPSQLVNPRALSNGSASVGGHET